MSHVLVVAERAVFAARHANNAVAVVATGMGAENMQLIAELCNRKVVDAAALFARRGQGVHHASAKQTVLAAGNVLIRAFTPEWLASVNLAHKRGTCPGLLTAYLLAVIHHVDRIVYLRESRMHVVPMHPCFLLKLSKRRMTIRFLP